MAQQNINLGTAAGANDGDTQYQAWTKAQSNFTELYAASTGLTNGKIFQQPISLTGVDYEVYTTELSRIARAVVIKNPGFTVPYGHLGVVSHYRSYDDEESNETKYYVEYYGLTQGPGNYGTITNPSYTDYTPGPGNIIKLGSLVSAPASEIELGDIGSSTVQDAINAASPSVTKSGFTVVTATISGVVRQFIFDAEDGDYGSADGSVGADNFIDAAAQVKASVDATVENKKPATSASDVTLDDDSFERLVIMTGNTATLTTPDDSDRDFPLGTKGRALFTGSGPHTFAYNSGGSAGAGSSFNVEQNGIIEFEKIAANDWIVYPVGNTTNAAQLLEIEVSISAAELASIATTPKVLIPAAGVNTVIVPLFIISDDTFVTTEYDFDGNGLWVKNTGGNNLLYQFQTDANATSSQTSMLYPSTADGGKMAKNTDLVLTANADPTQGDGTKKMFITYVIQVVS